MPRKPIVGGNWKSNPKDWASASKLLSDFSGSPAAAKLDSSKADFVIFPITLQATKLQEGLKGIDALSKISVGVQNCSKEAEGAFTGEVTVSQIKDSGIDWVLIGHSERRHKYGETNEDLALKVEKAQAVPGLKVIFCIGELLEERKKGITNEVCKEQLLAVVGKITDWDRIVIAYEPVWAIGTGEVATPQQAQDAHAACRDILKEAVSPEVADAVRIQYGGSVTPDNCGELIQCPDVDGFLVGGASLKVGFMDICAKVCE